MYTDDIFVRVDNMYKTTNSDIAQVACKTGIVASMRGVLVRVMRGGRCGRGGGGGVEQRMDRARPEDDHAVQA